jgi:hypothetical protein
MKKWFYIAVPVIFLAIFTVYYMAHSKETQERDRIRAEVAARKTAEEKAEKDRIEQQAREDAARKAAERTAEEQRKEQDRRAKQAAIDKGIQDEIAAAKAEAARFAKEVAALESELDRLRKERDRFSRETFELAKQVELAKVTRRNAELDALRMVEMISRRAAESSMTQLPTIPTPPAQQPRS